MPIPVRSLFESMGWGVDWKPGQGVNLSAPGGQRNALVPISQLQMQGGQAQMDPNQAGMFLLTNFLKKMNQPMTPDALQPYMQTASQMYEPTYQSSLGTLQGQEKRSLEGVRDSALANNTYTSPLYSYQQRKMAEAYAPSYQQLETSKMNNVNQGALNMFNQSQGNLAQSLQTIMSYLGTVGQQDTQKQQNALEAALARTQSFGRVTTPEDANLLGVPIGTSSWEATNAAANRKTQWDLANMPREESVSDLINKMKLEDEQNSKKEAASQMADVRRYQAQYGVDEGTATAVYGVLDNPTREAALYDLAQHKQELTKAGINVKILEKAIYNKWPLAPADQARMNQGGRMTDADYAKIGLTPAIMGKMLVPR